MKTVYIELDWRGPGYYRAVRSYRVNETSYMSLQRIGSLEDHENAEHTRRKGFKVFRARTQADLPEVLAGW